MDKDNTPFIDNFRIFRIYLDEKYRFYLFIIALFGLPIGLFRTSDYMLYFNYIFEYFSGSLSPSELIQLLFLYSPLFGFSILVQLGIVIMCLYVLIKIYGYQNKFYRSDEKHKLFSFYIDDEKRLILLGTSLFGIIMYTFHFLQWLNTLIYTIVGSTMGFYLFISSIPQAIFNLITCSIVVIFSLLILMRLYKLQEKEAHFPKIFSFTYHEHYIKLIFIFALIGIFASALFYIIRNFSYLYIAISYLYVYEGAPEELSLYYYNISRQHLIEIGRGVIILISSILTIKNIVKYQRQIRE